MGHRPLGRGIWLSLYEKESGNPVSLVGGGIGLAHSPIAKLRLSGLAIDPLSNGPDGSVEAAPITEAPLSIAEAKWRLATSLGVAETDIKITISA